MARSHDSVDPRIPQFSRRGIVAGLGVAAAGAALTAGLPMGHALALGASVPAVRKLAFTNLHTGEACRVVFQEKGEFDPAALDEINQVLRDHRTGEVASIDPRLLELLADLRRQLGSKNPVHVISGYRSPKTNAMLAANSTGVAKKSFHMRGMAIDCRLPDVPLKALHKAALKARRGGVGLYTRSGFVHLDVGPVRSW